MGANAQTTVPTFTAGQVLTAAQMNASARTGVPVFADTTARDAGFGGSGEKTLAQGQLVFIESGNIIQFYDGAAWVPVRRTLQVVNSQTGAVATGTTTIPFDDTIPQNTEGTEFLSVSITPSSTTNVLLIQAVLNYSYSIANTVTMALFQDTTANALAASAEYGSTATGMINSGLTHYMTAGTTSATTFKLRAGGETAGTLTLNGFSGARKLGGVMISSLTITEYAV